MPCYSLDGVIPVISPGAFVHPTAVLIGDVHVGSACYVGPGAVLRGDFGRVVLTAGANVQDNCVMHGFPDRETRVEENGHIGHGAILHSCIVRRDALVGMNAVVMDDAEVGEQSIIAACAFVPAGMVVPPRSLARGLPAKVVRQLSQAEIDWKRSSTVSYQTLALRCLASLREVQALAEVEPDRPLLQVNGVKPLAETKRSLPPSQPEAR